MSTHFHHVPVLLDESGEHLRLGPGATVLDGTLGGGGHAEAILDRTAPDGILVGLDRDPQALAASESRLARFGDRVRLVHSSFRRLDTALERQGIDKVDGVLFDLGVSSHQLDAPERGFRFADPDRQDTPLDMRMDATEGASAADLIRHASAEELLEPNITMEGDVVVCSDHAAAKKIVMDLADQIKDLRGVDGGSLANAKYVEQITPLLVNINRIYKTHSSIKIVGI